MVVEGLNLVNEVVVLGHVVSSVLSLERVADQGVHDVVSSSVIMLPGARVESQEDVGLRGLSPGSVLSSDVFRGSSLIEMLGDGHEFTNSFLDQVHLPFVVLHS